MTETERVASFVGLMIVGVDRETICGAMMTVGTVVEELVVVVDYHRRQQPNRNVISRRHVMNVQ